MNEQSKEVMSQVRDLVRQPHAFPGGYPKFLLMSDGETLCPKCAGTEYKLISAATHSGDRQSGWAAGGVDIYWEGPPMQCAHCNDDIESAYGDPDE